MNNFLKLFSFSTFQKHKYLYFIFGSLLCAFLVQCLDRMFNSMTFREMMRKTFLLWGFWYPVMFYIYETARKRKMDAKQIK